MGRRRQGEPEDLVQVDHHDEPESLEESKNAKGEKTSRQTPCRHLSCLSVGRISKWTDQSDTFIHANCSSCKTVEEDEGVTDYLFVCLGCFETCCLTHHLLSHARGRNHPLFLKLQKRSDSKKKSKEMNDADSDSLTKLYYCGTCKSEPVVKATGAGKKDLILLEKIGKVIGDKIDNQVPGQVRILIDEKKEDSNENASSVQLQQQQQPKGLVNLGNTCFMNSALQALSATLQFTSTMTFNEKWLKSSMWTALISLSEQIYKDRSKEKRSASVVNPGELLGLISRKYKKFAFLQQQDSHDFIRLLFNSIAEELKEEKNGKKEKEKEGKEAAQPHETLFGGKMVSRVVCKTCRRVSDVHEPFLDLSLALKPRTKVTSLERSLERLSVSDLEEEASSSDSDAELNLKDLLKSWADPIKLEGENAYYCEHCSKADDGTVKLQPATLQYFLEELPRFLILHLQRFKSSYRVTTVKKQVVPTLVYEKDHSSVEFPLDLHLSSELGKSSSEYELYAYVIHEGASTTSGHYTAVVRTLISRQWYHISDSRVTEISEKKALSGYLPYLLFYRQKQCCQ